MMVFHHFSCCWVNDCIHKLLEGGFIDFLYLYFVVCYNFLGDFINHECMYCVFFVPCGLTIWDQHFHPWIFCVPFSHPWRWIIFKGVDYLKFGFSSSRNFIVDWLFVDNGAFGVACFCASVSSFSDLLLCQMMIMLACFLCRKNPTKFPMNYDTFFVI